MASHLWQAGKILPYVSANGEQTWEREQAAPGKGGRLAPCLSKHQKMPFGKCQWLRAGLGISILSMAAVWNSFPAKSWRITPRRSSSSSWFHFAPFSPALLLIHCSPSLITAPAPSCTKVLFFVLSFHWSVWQPPEKDSDSHWVEKGSPRGARMQLPSLYLPQFPSTQLFPRDITTCIVSHPKPAGTLVLVLSKGLVSPQQLSAGLMSPKQATWGSLSMPHTQPGLPHSSAR